MLDIDGAETISKKKLFQYWDLIKNIRQLFYASFTL
jgi:hypothetical protein